MPSLVLRERVLPDGWDAAISGPVSGAEAQRRRASRGGTLSRSGGEGFRSRGETVIAIYSAQSKKFSEKIIRSLKEELRYVAVLELDGVVAA